MTKKEFLQDIEDQMSDMLRLVESKNADYTGDSGDPFHCFVGAAEYAGISVIEGILWEIGKKEIRLSSLLNGCVDCESIDDTLKDLAAYCMILRSWRKAKKEGGV